MLIFQKKVLLIFVAYAMSFSYISGMLKNNTLSVEAKGQFSSEEGTTIICQTAFVKAESTDLINMFVFKKAIIEADVIVLNNSIFNKLILKKASKVILTNVMINSLVLQDNVSNLKLQDCKINKQINKKQSD